MCFRCAPELSSNIILHNIQKCFLCEQCSYLCDNKNEFKRHQETEHKTIERKHRPNQKRLDLQCEICSRTFLRLTNLQQHLSNHITDYFCDVCCNSYISKYHLNLHKLTHSEEEIHQCKDNPSIVQCPYECTEKFRSKLQLFEHKKVHKRVVDYKCTLCPKKFIKPHQLDAHKKNNHNLCVCSVCGKRYANRKSLAIHVTTLHSSENKYNCSFCDLKFRCPSTLKLHETSHTGKKKHHKCGQCERSFARSDYLKEHIRIHANEKPFACHLCAKSFRQRNVLKTHIKKNHRTCSVCDVLVGNALKLRMHMWKTHSQDNPEIMLQLGNSGVEVVAEPDAD